MKKLIDDTLKPYIYKGESGWKFVVLCAVFVGAYVGLALAHHEIPHGLDLIAGAVFGHQAARTFRPQK